MTDNNHTQYLPPLSGKSDIISVSPSPSLLRGGSGWGRGAAALFDMDGVLYDSMKGHVVAYRQALEQFGYDMPEDIVYQCEGMKGPTTIQWFVKEHYNKEITIDEANEMYEEKCRIFRDLPRAEKIPGVHEFMKTLHNAGIQICVVTGSGQISLLNRLIEDYPGLIDREHIVCSLDYKNGKPAPDPYLMGLKKCNAEAGNAIVVENAPLGVKAGKAAGIFTLAVNTGPLPRSVFEQAGADKVFNNMDEAREWFLG